MTARAMVAAALAAGALLSGCQSTVAGNPRGNAANPTEPSFPTSRPSRSTATPAPPPPSPAPPPTAAPAPRAEALPPQNGYVFIETASGKTRCQLSATEVGCEAQFTNPPTVDGSPANGVQVSAQGQLRWIVGNLGDIPVVTLAYRTYTAQGWTIVATEAGTRFTNDASSHGMFVSIDEVDAF
ncbi:hypothetical protein [Mycolicibacterium sp.]|uniref:hypothetical protein n=1 Tax=Mycolicibacterium sp. TaxID=2320850 RepID=UPI001A352AB5|nr:hypothetical protein [Mycolicibacterium sp.]MBJ7340209.1 hypothetical protein [Mycolicibacterium sp.]